MGGRGLIDSDKEFKTNNFFAITSKIEPEFFPKLSTLGLGLVVFQLDPALFWKYPCD